MSGLETAFLRVGGTVVKHVATAWLTRRKTEIRRGAELTDLIAQRSGGLRERDRRALRRKLEEVGELAGEQLEELCARGFADLAEGERLAALDTVVDALAESDLSDAVLLGVDLNPMSLAKQVLDQVPGAPARAGLGAGGCAGAVRPRPGPELRAAGAPGPRAARIRLPPGRGDPATRIRRPVRHRPGPGAIPVTSLDAPAGADHDEQFRATADVFDRTYESFPGLRRVLFNRCWLTDLSPLAGRDIRVVVGAKDRVKGIPLLRPGTVRRV
ncbi:hypothetical protein [Saccharopolyspora spinosa]|uniref:NACHT N-terminal Helical domain-containing protein n=1 Tax=Saccharopolyspora spinosa TaxID=60894 RepID=A0A2N3XVI3_SACSN|nr:hypothetical protein [Saccharopolyspora spinosa]PKW14665.1 hypothetical protein A8926_2299 [Saccharopolyspora spinosa]